MKIKEFINFINLTFSAVFMSISLVSFYNNNNDLGISFGLLSIFTGLTVLIFNFSKKIKERISLVVGVLYEANKVNSLTTSELDKLNSLFFDFEVEYFKITNSKLTNSMWIFKHGQPISMMVSEISKKFIESPKKGKSLSNKEIELAHKIFSKMSLSKIEVDNYLFDKYPKLKNQKENTIVSVEKIYE